MESWVEVSISEKWPVKMLPHRQNVPWGEWEKERLASMHAIIRPDNIVFDIGSEEGDLSVLYAIWGAKIVPFEPDPYVWPNYKKCMELNGHGGPPPAYFVGFAANETILSPPEIEPAFKLPARNGWPGCAYGPIIENHGFRNETERFHDTPKTRIDDFCQRHSIFPDVITIDVEGAEFEVLKGAADILKTRQPNIYVSLHPEFMFDKYRILIGQMFMFLWQCGYIGNLLAVDHEHHWHFSPIRYCQGSLTMH